MGITPESHLVSFPVVEKEEKMLQGRVEHQNDGPDANIAKPLGNSRGLWVLERESVEHLSNRQTNKKTKGRKFDVSLSKSHSR